MTAQTAAEPGAIADRSVAPWWHTVLVVALLALIGLNSGYLHGLQDLRLPGLDEKLSTYAMTLLGEWFLVLVIAWGLRRRGLSIGRLIAGRWPSYRAVFKDVGLGIGFLVLATPILGVLGHEMGADTGSRIAALAPKTGLELALWVVLSATAGFCEELIFRGYLSRQVGAWTNSLAAGLILQAIAFGAVHAYYNLPIMIIIMLEGLLLGLLAAWCKSLRPGMLAHALQDIIGGVARALA